MPLEYFDIFPQVNSKKLNLISDIPPKDLKRAMLIDSTQHESIIIEGSLKLKWLEVPKNKKFEQHFCYTFDGAMVNTGRLEKPSWRKVDNKLRRRIKSENKNASDKLCWRSNNIYVVKAFFTFGLRTPPEGHIDIIQTTDAPLLVYVPKRNPIPFKKEREFMYTEEYTYNVFTLKPYGIYIAHSKLSYILISVQKTLFQVDRMLAKEFNTQKSKNSHIRRIDAYPYTRQIKRPDPPKEIDPPFSVLPTKWDRQTEKRLLNERMRPPNKKRIHTPQHEKGANIPEAPTSPIATEASIQQSMDTSPSTSQAVPAPTSTISTPPASTLNYYEERHHPFSNCNQAFPETTTPTISTPHASNLNYYEESHHPFSNCNQAFPGTTTPTISTPPASTLNYYEESHHPFSNCNQEFPGTATPTISTPPASNLNYYEERYHPFSNCNQAFPGTPTISTPPTSNLNYNEERYHPFSNWNQEFPGTPTTTSSTPPASTPDFYYHVQPSSNSTWTNSPITPTPTNQFHSMEPGLSWSWNEETSSWTPDSTNTIYDSAELSPSISEFPNSIWDNVVPETNCFDRFLSDFMSDIKDFL